MFEHVGLLLSFVYVIALTELFASATRLVHARDRVRPSLLMISWMIQAVLLLLVNWLSYYQLSGVTHWTVAEISLQFLNAVIQYFTCSLLSMPAQEEGEVDMPAFFDKQRRVVFLAFSGLGLAAMALNYLDRASSTAALHSQTAWVGEDLLILPILAAYGLAGFAKARWLQWVGAVASFASVLGFFLSFTLPG